jgi:hypothetical protein
LLVIADSHIFRLQSPGRSSPDRAAPEEIEQ